MLVPSFDCSGMADQMITVFNTSGDTTSNIKYHEGFMGQRVAKVSCLAFHPHLVRYVPYHCIKSLLTVPVIFTYAFQPQLFSPLYIFKSLLQHI